MQSLLLPFVHDSKEFIHLSALEDSLIKNAGGSMTIYMLKTSENGLCLAKFNNPLVEIDRRVFLLKSLEKSLLPMGFMQTSP